MHGDSLYLRAKSKKYRRVFKVKSCEKTRQVRQNWSQQLEHIKQIPKGGTEPCETVPKALYSDLQVVATI